MVDKCTCCKDSSLQCLGSTVAAVRNNSCIEQNIVGCALKEVLLHTSIFTCDVCHTGWMLIQPNGWMVELGRAQ